jgi:hypothetical protein
MYTQIIAAAVVFVFLILYVLYKQQTYSTQLAALWPAQESPITMEPEDAKWAAWNRRGLNDSTW